MTIRVDLEEFDDWEAIVDFIVQLHNAMSPHTMALEVEERGPA